MKRKTQWLYVWCSDGSRLSAYSDIFGRGDWIMVYWIELADRYHGTLHAEMPQHQFH